MSWTRRVGRRAGLGLALALALLTGAAVLPSGCSYIALPGGIVVNFPGFAGEPLDSDGLKQRLQVPAGFRISEWASGIENARLMRFTASGDLLVSSPREGKIFLLERDANDDGRSDGTRVLLEGLHLPHGMALDGGLLWIAETDGVFRVPFDAAARQVKGPIERVVQGLPADGNHYTRTIVIGPDRRLYVSVGSSCNICLEEDPRRAAILSYALDGSDERIHASGLRNAVGIAFRPGTDELWATDNGRDLLGDEFPPCELNQIVEGAHYGWPYANGARVADPDFGLDHAAEVARSVAPAHAFGAHTAPLGLAFGAGLKFPEPWETALFVALHGSWNRRAKQGYEVVALWSDGGTGFREEPFVTGFEIDNEVVGRPVDVAAGPDGALYVSDDFTGQIYRVAWGEDAPVRGNETGVGKQADGGNESSGGRAAAVVGTPAATPRVARVPHDPFAGVSAYEREQALVVGPELWQDSGCAACHLPGTAAAESYRPLVGLRAKFDVERLTHWLAAPQPPMPRYPFDAEQRRLLAIWLLGRF